HRVTVVGYTNFHLFAEAAGASHGFQRLDLSNERQELRFFRRIHKIHTLNKPFMPDAVPGVRRRFERMPLVVHRKLFGRTGEVAGCNLPVFQNGTPLVNYFCRKILASCRNTTARILVVRTGALMRAFVPEPSLSFSNITHFIRIMKKQLTILSALAIAALSS